MRSKQQPTRPISQKPTHPTSSQKPTRPTSSQKPTRPTSSRKPIHPTSSPKPSRPTSSKKPTLPISPQKSTRPSPLLRPIPSSPQKLFWATRNSSKQAEVIPASTKSNKGTKKNKSRQNNDKLNVRGVSKPNSPSANDDKRSVFGRMFRKSPKIGNNGVVVNRTQELVQDSGFARSKKKYANENIVNLQKNKDTGKKKRKRENSYVSESLSIADKAEKKNKFKRMLRRQVWRLSKGSIKANKRLSSLLAENNINIDNIKPEAIDLTLINVDALGIENKLLKRTVTWLLK